MISENSIACSKEEIKSKSINLDEPVDPFNLMLTTYPPVSIINDYISCYNLYSIK